LFDGSRGRTAIPPGGQEYYQALGQADKSADATVFVEFMLAALRDACLQGSGSDQVSDQVHYHQRPQTGSRKEKLTGYGKRTENNPPR
jgi:hypothetical protein